MAEVDVDQLRVEAAKLCEDLFSLGPIDGDRSPQERLLPDSSNLVRPWFGKQPDFVKGEPVSILPLLTEHHRSECTKRSDLPVNVQHFRFEKRHDILSCYRRTDGHSDSLAEVRGKCAVESVIPLEEVVLSLSALNHQTPRMDYLAKARRVFEIEITEAGRVGSRLDQNFGGAVELIRTSLEARAKVVVIGVGKSGHIGEKIAATLTSTGSTAVVLNSLNALHGDLGLIADGDVVLALSSSGETDEMLNILPALRRWRIGLIAMTGNPRSTLAQNSDVVLDVSIEQEACPLNLAPTSSTTAMLVLGDALAMVLLEARGFTKDDFARFHPGGRLGRSLLLKVRDVMRGPEQLAVVRPSQLVREVITEMNRKRAGAAVVVDGEGRLTGIFTHGDFARHFQSQPDLGAVPVDAFVTRNPTTVRDDKLAVEVLRILQERRIDDIPVVDDSRRPIGIVDTQDLARVKLV
jgi:arabinose-5-phosphate isomerase